MNDIMVDIETLGTGPFSVITQIGACYFDRYSGEIGDTFISNIRIDDCLYHGLTISGSTLKFWIERANQCTWLKDPVDLTRALGLFIEFVEKDSIGWSHATFDFPILSNAYHIANMRMPIHYRNMRDIRTLVDLAGLNTKKEAGDPKTHNALDDCIYQVAYCVECFNEILRRKTS